MASALGDERYQPLGDLHGAHAGRPGQPQGETGGEVAMLGVLGALHRRRRQRGYGQQVLTLGRFDGFG